MISSQPKGEGGHLFSILQRNLKISGRWHIFGSFSYTRQGIGFLSHTEQVTASEVRHALNNITHIQKQRHRKSTGRKITKQTAFRPTNNIVEDLGQGRDCKQCSLFLVPWKFYMDVYVISFNNEILPKFYTSSYHCYCTIS